MNSPLTMASFFLLQFSFLLFRLDRFAAHLLKTRKYLRHHSSRPRIYLVTYVYICSMYLCKSSAALYLERASLCLCLSLVMSTL